MKVMTEKEKEIDILKEKWTKEVKKAKKDRKRLDEMIQKISRKEKRDSKKMLRKAKRESKSLFEKMNQTLKE
jgi:hypothetical protein